MQLKAFITQAFHSKSPPLYRKTDGSAPAVLWLPENSALNAALRNRPTQIHGPAPAAQLITANSALIAEQKNRIRHLDAVKNAVGNPKILQIRRNSVRNAVRRLINNADFT